MVTVGKGHGTGVQQKADLGHFAAHPALGQRGHGQHVHGGGFAGATDDEFQRLGIVNGRIGVGAGDDGRDTARRSGGTGRAETFLVTFAGFTDLHADVDDPGSQIFARTIDDAVSAIGVRVFNGLGQDAGDLAILDQKASVDDLSDLGVDQAGVGKEGQGQGRHPHSGVHTGFSGEWASVKGERGGD